MDEGFVFVKINSDHQGAVARQYGVEGLPTVVFLSPQGSELHRMVGYKSAEEFGRILEDVASKVKSPP